MYLCDIREDVGVRFPVSSGMLNLPLNYFETENQIKEMNWRKQTLQEDMKREQALLSHAKFNFEIKKQEFVKFLAESSSLASPVVLVFILQVIKFYIKKKNVVGLFHVLLHVFYFLSIGLI